MYTDKPISTKNQDRFQRYEFAKRIAQVIINRQQSDSLTIGLYGEWGEGKTSVMEFTSAELVDKAVIVPFNPWQFSNEQQLLTEFFTTLAEQIQVSLLTKKDKVADWLKEYGGFLTLGGLITKEVTEATSKVLSGNSLLNYRKVITEALVTAEQPIVIFIDDIDRLDTTEIQAMFRLVKLVGDFPNVVYVLAFDQSRVADALTDRFGNGYEYLEKIIQVPLRLPKAQSFALKQYTYDLLTAALQQPGLTITEDGLRHFKANFEKYLAGAITTPREPVRLNNAIQFALPMLNGEVHVGDLMLLESIKVLYPIVYDHIRDNSNTYLRSYSTGPTWGGNVYNENEQVKKRATETINTLLSRLRPQEQESVRQLLIELFPQLRSVYGNIVYADGSYMRWHQQKRICSAQHFDRFFTYAVIDGDLSDVHFENMLQTLDSDSLEAVVQYFESEFTKLEARNFIHKLRFYEGSFPADRAAQLARVLCRLGRHFVTNNALIISTATETVYFIRTLIKVQDEDKRVDLAKELMQMANPMPFALELHDKLWEHGREGASEFLLTEAGEREVQIVLFNRMLTQVGRREFFYDFDESDLKVLFAAWIKVNKAQLQEVSKRALEDWSDFSLKLIRIAAPTIHRISSHSKIFKTTLTANDMLLLEEIIDLNQLYETTIKHYGMLTYNPKLEDSPVELSDMLLIAHFQDEYQRRQQAKDF